MAASMFRGVNPDSCNYAEGANLDNWGGADLKCKHTHTKQKTC